MKATIYPQISGDRVANVVPPAYRALLPDTLAPEQRWSVLLFAHADRDVVPSAAVRRALRRLGDSASDGLLAVGTVFTEEAQALLSERHARIVAQRKGRWTDQSARERQL